MNWVQKASSLVEKTTGLKLHSAIKPLEPNVFEGFALGLIGANVGLLAMTLYQNYAAKPILDASPEADKNPSGNFDSISVVGTQHKDDESSTAALGRLALQATTGDEPRNAAAEKVLSYGVHWGFGMLMGGLYGAALAGKTSSSGNLGLGMAYGAGLWAFGDELAVPLFGLQDGPTAASKTQHGNRLAAHLLYGAGLAIGTQAITHVWRNSNSGAFDNFWNFDEIGLEEAD